MTQSSTPRCVQRVAIVTPLPWHATDPAQFSIDLTIYAQAFAARGIEPLIVCPIGSEVAGSSFATRIANPPELVDGSFWRSLNADVAFTLTWLRHAPMLAAQRAAGLYTASKGDTDGRVSPRLWPQARFTQLVAAANHPVERMRRFKYWTQQLLFQWRALDEAVLESLSVADVSGVETLEARDHLAHFTTHYGRPDLMSRVRVWPHCLSDTILQSPLPSSGDKRRSVVAVGRWDAAQKDAPLLAAAIDRFLATDAESDVTIIGKAGDAVLKRISDEHRARTRVLGSIPRDEIAPHLRRARVLVFSSRWESFHIAAHEALCLGASVVGPRVTPMPDLEGNSEIISGTVARHRTAASLSDALHLELAAWDRGERDPLALAHYWRSHLGADVVVGDILRTMCAASAPNAPRTVPEALATPSA